VLRSAKTDPKGKFGFSDVTGRPVHYLQLTSKGFNLFRVRVKADHPFDNTLRIQMQVGT
jgi:hypothetical protein